MGLNQTFLCVAHDSNKNIALNFVNFGKLLKDCVYFFDDFLNKFKEKSAENLNERKTLLINEKHVDIWI